MKKAITGITQVLYMFLSVVLIAGVLYFAYEFVYKKWSTGI